MNEIAVVRGVTYANEHGCKVQFQVNTDWGPRYFECWVKPEKFTRDEIEEMVGELAVVSASVPMRSGEPDGAYKSSLFRLALVKDIAADVATKVAAGKA